MPERYFLYCEDIEWSFKAKQIGLGYAHNAIVFLPSGTTIGSASHPSTRSSLSIYWGHRNTLVLTRKWYPVLYPFTVLHFAFFFDNLVRGSRRGSTAALRGWWAGVWRDTGRPIWFKDIR